jgi:hypothetical protein
MRWQKVTCALFAVLIAVVIIYPLFIHPMFHLTQAQRSQMPLAAILAGDFTILGRLPAISFPPGFMGHMHVNTRALESASLLFLKCSLLC